MQARSTLVRSTHDGQRHPALRPQRAAVPPALRLHRSAGNQAVAALLRRGLRSAVEPPRMKPAVAARTATARIQRVQLTYDDGPDSAGNTAAVLKALNDAGAKATFYLVGKRVAQGSNWKTVFQIAASGHWLGNHAYDWDDVTDNHIFLKGTATERAEKILNTEWSIRDALIQGRDDAKAGKTWDAIPKTARDYIEDVIAHGTGRFRTPGFKSKWWNTDGSTTLAAIASANTVLAAVGLRPLQVTEVSSWGLTHEGVDIDPEDWRSGRTKEQVETKVKDKLSSNSQSILLHSRIAATAAATPEVLKAIGDKSFSYDPTVQGDLGAKVPKAGFAGLSTISKPPTSTEIAAAKKFLFDGYKGYGPYLSASLALGIFQMAAASSQAEVLAFAKDIKGTTVETPDGTVPMANWLMANPDWGLFATFFENWMTSKPFPKIKGVTI